MQIVTSYVSNKVYQIKMQQRKNVLGFLFSTDWYAEVAILKGIVRKTK